jgi:hypothetical protein
MATRKHHLSDARTERGKGCIVSGLGILIPVPVQPEVTDTVTLSSGISVLVSSIDPVSELIIPLDMVTATVDLYLLLTARTQSDDSLVDMFDVRFLLYGEELQIRSLDNDLIMPVLLQHSEGI